MVSFVPSFGLLELLKYGPFFKKNCYFEKIWKNNKKQSLFLFSRSSWSISFITSWYLKHKNTNRLKIWVPSYFCNQALIPVRNLNVDIAFYPITRNMIPNWQWCDDKVKADETNIFILVHYFGVENEIRKTRKFCNKKNALFIEDAAHVFIPTGQIGRFSDFTLYSLYKFLPISDGAVLTTNIKNSDIINQLEKQHLLLCRTKENGHKWFLKSIIKKITPSFILSNYYRNKTRSHSDNEGQTEFKQKPGISSFSENYIKNLTLNDINKMKQMRCKNYELIKFFLDSYNFNNQYNSTPGEYAIFSTFSDADKILTFLSNRFLPCSTWPDLAPEVVNDSKIFENANIFRQSAIIFPIYPMINLKTFVKGFRKDIYKNDNITIHRDCCSKLEWTALLSKSSQSNLLQTWEYGEAKKIEGWTVERIIFKKNEDTVAYVQVLGKKIPFIKKKVYRINRGPLFIDEYKKDLATIQQVWAKLKTLYGFAKLKPLLIAPELQNKSSNKHILRSNNYFHRIKHYYLSSWVCLTKSEDQLRSNLVSKWRNMLNVAEKSGLVLSVTNERSQLSWLMDKYQKLMETKSFQGTPINIINSLYDNEEGRNNFLVLIAKKSEIPVAAILMSLHGNSATYLVGWNSDEGRPLKANNFLLWNALLELKGRGTHWLDLGGMDEKNLPQITLFKKGINGAEYNLIGEWV